MKRFVALMLVLCLLLPGCGSSEMTFEQFQDKYKRSTWLEDPEAFIREYTAMKAQPLEKIAPDLSSYTKEEKDGQTQYSKGCVLFNKSFTFTIYVEADGYAFTGLRYAGDPDECIQAFEKLLDTIIKIEGDPQVVNLDFDEVDEPALRKALSSGTYESTISVSWKGTTSKSGQSTLISWMNFLECYLTIY